MLDYTSVPVSSSKIVLCQFTRMFMLIGTPTVTSLSFFSSNSTSMFTLNCTSSDSPPTTVIWNKNGGALSDSSASYQTLRDGSSSTYDTLLPIDGSVDELVGTYTCSVLNSAGQSNVQSLNVQGMCESC